MEKKLQDNMIKSNSKLINFESGEWGVGIGGDWGLGIGAWAQSPIPNPQSPLD